MLARDGSYAKVWKVPGETEATVVSQGNDTEPYGPFFFHLKKKKNKTKQKTTWIYPRKVISLAYDEFWREISCGFTTKFSLSYLGRLKEFLTYKSCRPFLAKNHVPFLILNFQGTQL